MNRAIAKIPLSGVEKIQVYINTCKKSLAQIKRETGAAYLINGGLFDMAKWYANCHLKAEGYIHAQDPYSYWGYAWDSGPDIAMQSIPNVASKNYICCVELLRGGKPQGNLIYTPPQGGKRGRTAMGLDGDNLCLYVSADGTNEAKTPEQLRDELTTLGWDSAIMLDSGGSSQCDLNGETIESSRVVHNLILVYLKKGEKPVSDKKYIVCLDPGHGPGTVNGSPDGSYKEMEFTWDMYTRIRPLLEQQGIKVVATRAQNEKPDLLPRCKVSNDAKANLFVSLHTNAAGSSGWVDACGLLVYTSAGPETAARNKAALAMLRRFREAGVNVRGAGLVHNIDLTVLAKTDAAACLIEYGFHTNQGDVKLLKDSAYRNKLALATAQGICDYLGIGYQETEKPKTPWYDEDQKWAVGQGITDGTRPGDAATRAEVWAMMRKFGGAK